MSNKLPKVKDLIGKPLQRDEAYQMRLFERALSEDIKKDVVVMFGDYYELQREFGGYQYGRGFGVASTRKNIPNTPNKSKVKAYCEAVNSYLQFPRDLRKPGTKCICDIVSTEHDKVNGFWRYIKGTVRKEGSDIVVA